jgi:O-antigen ligase
MPAPETGTRLWTVALVLACLFVATLPFYHLHTLRTTALGFAALAAFLAAGWRELILLPAKTGWWAWIIVAAISVWYAGNRFASFSQYRYEILYTFGAWATWYALARRRDGARWLGRVLTAVTLLALLLGFATFATGQPWFDLGRFGDVGSVSTYLVTVLPVFLLYALRSKPHSAARFGAITVVAGCLVAGFLTLNRMFSLAAAAELTIFALFSMRYWDSRFRAASMLGVGALVAALALVEVFSASESRIALATPGTGVWEFLATDPRGELWHFAIGRIADHPWLGAGLGKMSSRDAFVAQFGNPMLLHAHNAFLNRALETGLPGLLAFLFLLGQVTLGFGRVARSADADTAVIGAAGLALVAGVVVKNLTDDFFIQQNALLFWSLAGAGLGATAAREDVASVAAS